jgi:hypothetical protein
MKCEDLDDLIALVIVQLEDELTNEDPGYTARGLVRELIRRYDLEFIEL